MNRAFFVRLMRAALSYSFEKNGMVEGHRSAASLDQPIKGEGMGISRLDFLHCALIFSVPALVVSALQKNRRELKIVLEANEFLLPANDSSSAEPSLKTLGAVKELLEGLRDLNSLIAREPLVVARFAWRAVRGEGDLASEWMLGFSFEMQERMS